VLVEVEAVNTIWSMGGLSYSDVCLGEGGWAFQAGGTTGTKAWRPEECGVCVCVLGKLKEQSQR
jgi:hypothetical protein